MRDIFPYFIHLGALLYFVCFLFRNTILLRSFAIAADLAYVLYYLTASTQPLWEAAGWSVLIILTNALMLVRTLRDQSSANFDDTELKLYRCLGCPSPATFRLIARMGKWTRVISETVLTTAGQRPQHLHYIVEGEVEISKDERKFAIMAPLFIGEVAFLRHTPASATVRVKPGALHISWSCAELSRAQLKYHNLHAELSAMLNVDLADKLARA